MAEVSTPTYDSLQNNEKFLTAAYHTLKGLGISTSKDPTEIVDSFLTHRRYFDINLLSAIKQGNRIMELPDNYKEAYAYAVDEVEKVPNFGEGAAPKTDAIIDYGIAGLTDPTNLLSILAGAATAGGGGAVGFAAKEAVKQGIKNRLRDRIKAAFSKSALKAYAVEGSFAGLGGLEHARRSQTVDIDIGRRKDYNPVEMAAQGTEAVFNIPVNRMIKKADNIEGALNENNEAWQKVLMMLGWSKWDVGVSDYQKEKKKEKETPKSKTRKKRTRKKRTR